MAMVGLLEVLMVLLTGGGGNDLLDYLPGDAYWKAKGVTVTVERLAGELVVAEPADAPALVRDLGAEDYRVREAATRKLRALGPAAAPELKKAADSDDPEVRTRARELLAKLAGSVQAKAVRRLMAIRTLGELKKPQALQALRSLLASKELFVADYARQAIAAIEGKPYTRPRPAEAMLWRDLSLLPKRCGVVAQAAMPPGRPVPVRKLLEKAKGAIRPGQDVDQLLDQLTKMLLQVAERVGNVRVDRVTFGLTDNVGDDVGAGVVVVRGLYDAAAARVALKQLGLAVRKVEGIDVFAPGEGFHLIPCASDLFVVVAGPEGEQLPVREVVAAIRRKPSQPAFDDKMLALVKSVDVASPLWSVVRVSEAYRMFPLLAPLETLTLTSQEDPSSALALTLVARARKGAALKGAVDQFENGLKTALKQTRRGAQRAAFLKPIVELLESVKLEAHEQQVTVTAKLKGASSVLMMPFLMHVVRAAPRPLPPDPVEGGAEIDVAPQKAVPR